LLISIQTIQTTSGYIFPALVTALVPLRSWVVSCLFTEEDLKHLDPAGETEDDYLEEQEVFHHERRPSLNEADMAVGFSAFRPAGVPHSAGEMQPPQEEIVPHKRNEGASSLKHRKNRISGDV
jgi:hypothetical protein